MLKYLLGHADNFAVVDTETTGLYNTDRIVEIATVTLNRHGRIVDEWDTLINPLRDIGPTHLHGIHASMVSAAPTFDEIAGALAERLHGAVIVAHNLTFDTRMMVNEFERTRSTFLPGAGVCTLRISGERLTDACTHHGIPLHRHHRALADARATAQLLRRLASQHRHPTEPAAIEADGLPFRPRTLRRETVAETEAEMPYIARLADRVHHYGEHGPALVYLDQLDYALADLQLSHNERTQLASLAADVGLNASDIARLHTKYLDQLVAASSRDGVITEHESRLLRKVATALGLQANRADDVAARWQPDEPSTLILQPGLRVCFTGAATYPDGSELSRSQLHRIAQDLGLSAVDSLTKKTDLLIAADPETQSGKASRARSYEVPIASVEDFLLAQPGGTLPVQG